VYSELPEKLRGNSLEQGDVDDFLWIMMVQWAKLAAWQIKRGTKTTAQVEQTYLTNKIDAPKSKNSEKDLLNVAAAMKSGAHGRHKILTQKLAQQQLAVMPMGSLTAVIEGAYLPGEGRMLADPQHYVSEYVRRVGINRNILKYNQEQDMLKAAGAAAAAAEGGASEGAATATNTTAGAAVAVAGASARGGPTNMKFLAEIDRIMQECILWDTTNLDAGYRRALAYISTGTLAGPEDTAAAAAAAASASKAATPTPPISGSPVPQMSAAGGKLQKQRSAVLQDDEEVSPVDGGAGKTGPMIVLLPFSPELGNQMVKLAFAAYQAPIATFLEEVRLFFVSYFLWLFAVL
jgi:hypothetical protein